MSEQFSAVVDLAELQRALRAFEIDAGVVPVQVRVTVDDRSALTVEACTPAPVTIQGASAS